MCRARDRVLRILKSSTQVRCMEVVGHMKLLSWVPWLMSLFPQSLRHWGKLLRFVSHSCAASLPSHSSHKTKKGTLCILKTASPVGAHSMDSEEPRYSSVCLQLLVYTINMALRGWRMGSERQWKRNLLLYRGSMRQEGQSEQAEEIFLNSAVFVETVTLHTVYVLWEYPRAFQGGLGRHPASGNVEALHSHESSQSCA